VDTEAVAKHRPSLRQWLHDDSAGYSGPRKVVHMFKVNPGLWLWLIIYLGVPVADYVGILAAIGELDEFGTWIIVPTMLGAISFGAHLHVMTDAPVAVTSDDR
jgi:hypothetical protein